MASPILHERSCAYCGATFHIAGKGAGGAKFCSIDCNFWSKVDRSGGPNACWPWTGKKTRTGYGALTTPIGGRSGSTHRSAYILTHGHPPAGLVVCHRCDNRPCCNPAHLFAGTQRDNLLDMVAKGRTNHSPEYIEKIRASRIGKKHSEATRAKISAAKMGKRNPPESDRKGALKRVGRMASPEKVQKCREAALLRYKKLAERVCD